MLTSWSRPLAPNITDTNLPLRQCDLNLWACESSDVYMQSFQICYWQVTAGCWQPSPAWRWTRSCCTEWSPPIRASPRTTPASSTSRFSTLNLFLSKCPRGKKKRLSGTVTWIDKIQCRVIEPLIVKSRVHQHVCPQARSKNSTTCCHLYRFENGNSFYYSWSVEKFSWTLWTLINMKKVLNIDVICIQTC